MSEVTTSIGEKIRFFRKARNMSTEELARKIHKSRSTTAKYEQGTIVLDIETLYMIADALKVEPNQLLCSPMNQEEYGAQNGRGIFYKAKEIYLYYLSGQKNTGIRRNYGEIDSVDGTDYLTLYACVNSRFERESAVSIYRGTLRYTDVYTRFELVNQVNPIDYVDGHIVNSFTTEDACDVLLTSVVNHTYVPVALHAVVSRSPLKEEEKLLERLLFSKEEIRMIRKKNALYMTTKTAMLDD